MINPLYTPSLNESPSEKEGKSHPQKITTLFCRPLNESPSEKEGKFRAFLNAQLNEHPQ